MYKKIFLILLLVLAIGFAVAPPSAITINQSPAFTNGYAKVDTDFFGSCDSSNTDTIEITGDKTGSVTCSGDAWLYPWTIGSLEIDGFNLIFTPKKDALTGTPVSRTFDVDPVNPVITITTANNHEFCGSGDLEIIGTVSGRREIAPNENLVRYYHQRGGYLDQFKAKQVQLFAQHK